MTTLVTGATGFLGSAVARALLDAGHAVRVLTRQGADTRNIDGLDVERAIGDLNDRASLERAAKGCDTLFHVAADYRLWIPDPPAIYRTNVEGSRDLLRAAAAAGATRIVYTSSVATLGLNADHSPADEETPVTEAAMIGHYKRSKYLAEEAVRALARDEGVPAVIVNPQPPSARATSSPRPQGESSWISPSAGCRPMSIPASTWSTSTIAPPATCRRSRAAPWGSATSWAART